MNVFQPGAAPIGFRGSKIVAFSSVNVYPLDAPLQGGGETPSTPPSRVFCGYSHRFWPRRCSNIFLPAMVRRSTTFCPISSSTARNADDGDLAADRHAVPLREEKYSSNPRAAQSRTAHIPPPAPAGVDSVRRPCVRCISGYTFPYENSTISNPRKPRGVGSGAGKHSSPSKMPPSGS